MIVRGYGARKKGVGWYGSFVGTDRMRNTTDALKLVNIKIKKQKEKGKDEGCLFILSLLRII